MIRSIRICFAQVTRHIPLGIRIVFCKPYIGIGPLIDEAVTRLFVYIFFRMVIAVLLFRIRIIIGRYTYLYKFRIIKSMAGIQRFCLFCRIGIVIELRICVSTAKCDLTFRRQPIVKGIQVNGGPNKVQLAIHRKF